MQQTRTGRLIVLDPQAGSRRQGAWASREMAGWTVAPRSALTADAEEGSPGGPRARFSSSRRHQPPAQRGLGGRHCGVGLWPSAQGWVLGDSCS